MNTGKWLAFILTFGVVLHIVVRVIFTKVVVFKADWILIILIETLLAFLCAVWVMGLKTSFRMLLVVFALSWLVEEIGVTTGLLFGEYYYTEKLGLKLLDVPVVVPLAWFMVIFVSNVMANYIGDRSVVTASTRVPHELMMSLIAAFIAVVYDMCTDPIMVHQVKAWVWVDGGEYFGIPLKNFAGWLSTAFILSCLSRYICRNVPRPDSGSPSRKWIAAYPFLAYASFALGYAVIDNPPGTRVVGLFAMGGLVILTIPGFRHFLRESPAPAEARESASEGGSE